MRIAFANDHAGYPARAALLTKLHELGHEVLDFGTASTDSVDYPDYAVKAIQALLDGQAERVVLVCGSGIGMSIAANRFRGVRCALVTDMFAAGTSRSHNDANALALRAREQTDETNVAILQKWLETPFDGGRHERRVCKIDQVVEELTTNPKKAEVPK